MKYFILMSLLLSGMLSMPAWAGGFHYDVGVSSRLLSDEQQRLTAIQMSWVHDAEVSALLLEGEARDTENLSRIAKRIADDLQNVAYFTLLRAGEQTVKFGKARDQQVQLLEGDKVWLSFTLPLAEALPVSGQTLHLTLQDEGGGAANLAYTSVTDIALDDGLRAVCAVDLKALEAVEHGAASQLVTIACR